MQPKSIADKRFMKRTNCAVRVEGVDVILTIGSVEHRMDYGLALKLATFMYYGGKVAKKAAGDEGMRIIGIADLTDANADELEAQFNRDRTAVFSRVKG